MDRRIQTPEQHLWYHLPPPVCALPGHFFFPLERFSAPPMPTGAGVRMSQPIIPTSSTHGLFPHQQSPGPELQDQNLTQPCPSRIEDDESETLIDDTDIAFMEFLEQTRQHRRNRDRNRRILQRKKSATGTPSASARDAQSRAKAQQREQEAKKEFYGEHYRGVLHLETALNVRHDSNRDAFKPRLWPAIPLSAE
eukprot:m.131667 g.131667  ORF g.131667 m.131667 type:complete len:195 (-) comp17477_c0_seq12:121-705(-)